MLLECLRFPPRLRTLVGAGRRKAGRSAADTLMQRQRGRTRRGAATSVSGAYVHDDNTAAGIRRHGAGVAGLAGALDDARLARSLRARRAPCAETSMTQWRRKPADEVYAAEEIEARLKAELPAWYLEDGWIRRKYRTSGWKATLMVVNTVGHLAEAAWHHPDLTVSYAFVIVKLTTHSAKGVTEKDFALARRIEDVVTWLGAGYKSDQHRIALTR